MVDARGLACPMPVVMVQKEVKKSNPAELTVLVDNQCTIERISEPYVVWGKVFVQTKRHSLP